MYKSPYCKELYVAVCSFIIFKLCLCDDEGCDRRPLGTTTPPLQPDDRFLIDIIGIDDTYIPNHNYTVRLYSRNNDSTFIAFTISIREDTKYNEKNPRKPIALDPGTLTPSPNSLDTKTKMKCNNIVIQTDITPKTSVEAIWTAPPKENKCVTIYAVVAVKPDVWYSYEGPLSKRVCEDRRKAEDMQPMANDNCQVCEEARYQLTFEGMWSYNTHPTMFPSSKSLARFSDVVGASHSKNFHIYKSNADASEGLKMLAEQGNTTKLEIEIQKKLGTDVRTIIKATGPPKPSMTTMSSFRVTREHHLVSLVAAILPSPDWFLGVDNFELCDVNTGQWAVTATLNLYPMDAGTDSGIDFESPNEETSPPQPISKAVINSYRNKEQMRPFARLHFDLVRTYFRPDCTTDRPIPELKGNGDSSTMEEITTTTTTSEEPPTPDPDSTAECPMTAWEEWLPCEGECIDQKIEGAQIRFRYHMVDGVAVGKYVENAPAEVKDVAQYCLDQYPVSETRECEESCEEEIMAPAQRRIWREPVKPGQSWGRR